MKILHIYPKSEPMIVQHVHMLADGLKHSAEVHVTDNLSDFKTICRQMEPDIVHCHGCWHHFVVSAAHFGQKQGARIVMSPHGQLEPWVVEEKPVQERMLKRLLWQRHFVEKAYAVIVFGKMERQFLQKLKWNPRIEEIHNSLITNSITQQEMCSQTFIVYQKVMDSNVLEQMDDDTRQLLAAVIKSGITGDRRWVTLTVDPQKADWRRLLLYAEHENIRDYVDYGINILGLNAPHLDTSKIPAYFPESYQRPVSLKQMVGDYKGDETDYLVRMIRQIEKKPLLLHLIELARELRRDLVDDGKLSEALEEKKLLKFASRLMPILQEETLLDEGYMPLPPIDDRGTRQIRHLINNHLSI